MSSHSSTPWNKNIDFLFDIETTGLPGKHYLTRRYVDGKLALPPIEEVLEAFASHTILQFGYSADGQDTKHINIVETSTGFMPQEGQDPFDVHTTFKGERVKTRVSSVRKHSEADIFSYLKKSGKLNDRQIEYYMGNIAPMVSASSADMMYTFDLEDGQQLYTSRFSKKRFLEKTDEQLANEVKTYGFKDGESFFKMTHDAFSGAKENESLYKLIDDIVKQTEAGVKKSMGAWGAMYDVNFIRYMLHQSGHGDLLGRFESAVANGSLQMHSVEKEWQLIVWKLVQENPDLADSFKIGYHPEAFAETGGRFGKVAQTFEEFQYSTLKWNTDSLSRYFSWNSKVGSLTAAHHAGADVKLEKAILEQIGEIKDEAFRLARDAGLNFGSFEEFAKSKTDRKLMEEAISNVMGKHVKGNTADILKKAVAADAKATAASQAERFPSYIAAKLTETTKTKLAKYGGLAATVGILLGATYLFGRKETSTYGLGDFKIGQKASLGTDLHKQYSEKETEAHVSREFFQKVVAGALIPISALYAAGAINARSSRLFGVVEKTPETALDLIKSIGRTTYAGLRLLESNIPLSRAFKAQSIIEYYTGSKRMGERTNRAGEKFYKGTHIPVIRDGALVDPEFKTDIDNLIDAAKITNPNEAKEIAEFLKPASIPENLDRASLILSRANDGSTVAILEKIGKDGKPLGQKRSILLALDSHIARTSMPNILKRNMKGRKSAARYLDEMGGIKNPVVTHKLSDDLVFRKGITKLPFANYMRFKNAPDFARDNDFFTKMWEGVQRLKYELDLVPKGVGEGRNELRPQLSRELYHTKQAVIVKHLKGDNKWTPEGITTAKRFLRYPIKEYTYHSINTFLETPFEFIGIDDWWGKTAKKLAGSNSAIGGIAGKAMGFIHRPNLGLDTAAIHGLPEYLLKFGLKRLLPAYLGFEAIRATDHLLGWATFSPTGRGPLGTAVTAIPQAAGMLYSKISDMFGLTNVAKRQESVAPGSTGLGIMALGASLSTTWLMGEYAHQYGPENLRSLMDKGIQKVSSTPFVQRAMRNEAWKGALRDRGPMERVFSWAIKNPKTALFGLGLIPTIPFWPGLIGSNKSYKERTAEYRGEKEVAIRKSRGWILSGSPFAGENVIQYRKHALNLFRSDFENRGVVWESYRQRVFHNMTLGLFDRYGLEEYHAKDQPVYQSAGYGSGVPLIGPLIASTIGRIVKPTRTYHLPHEGLGGAPDDPSLDTIDKSSDNAVDLAKVYLRISGSNVSLARQMSEGYIRAGRIAEPGLNIKMVSENSLGHNLHEFKSAFAEFAGFKGFFATSIQQFITGKKSSDEFTPYAEDATQMYNPAGQMWAYNLGDISLVGGEFLRRVFQSENKKWEVNNIPNELFGQSWIPHDRDHGRDFWRGTTYNEVPMGWLYASRKGWEHLFPTMKDVSLENYPDPIRLEILKGLAPSSPEFNVTSSNVMKMAMSNQLDPYQEQRYYNTLDQVRHLKEKVYAHASNYTYSVPTEAMSGKLTELNLDSSEFTVKTSEGDKRLRLAGVSTNLQDIRARLLKSNEYKTAAELDENAREIQQRLHSIISSNMKIGDNIDFRMAGEGSFTGDDKVNEAIVGSLNNTLLNKGAPLADTGNLGTFNMRQEQAGMTAKGMAKYWDLLNDADSFWGKKLIPNRDYLENYATNQVFNREVKLWSRPIEHILKPMIASTMRHFGVDKIPTFTMERRDKQQYWDVIKYIKYKMLAIKSQSEGDTRSAHYYHTMWRRTMVGANPLDHNDRDEMLALPSSERKYFKFFANEPDPEKRAKIFKYVPAAERRILEGIWTRQLAQTSDDKDVQDAYRRLSEAEGWKLNEDEEEEYRETGDGMSKGDWARAKFVSKFADTHAIPGLDWEGWDENVSLENVEISALKDQGEQTEDYGFFENKVRQAAFDSPAFQAALDINSLSTTSSDVSGTIIPFIASYDGVANAYSMPTTSQYPLVSTNIRTNGHMKAIERSYDPNAALIPESMYTPRSHLNGW